MAGASNEFLKEAKDLGILDVVVDALISGGKSKRRGRKKGPMDPATRAKISKKLKASHAAKKKEKEAS